MKKSLLKRAVSAAVSLPLALTQCVLPAIAAEPAVNNAEVKSITIDKITNIAVDEKYTEANGVYTQDSAWAETLSGAFLANDGVSYDVEQEQLDSLFSKIINKAGAYADEAEMILSNIKDVKVAADSQGKIVATATLEDISGSIEELCEKEINKAIDELKAKYGEEYTGKLDNFSFECPAIAGEIKATIDMSDVEKENGGNVTYTFSADGKTYTGVEEIKGYVDSQLEAIKAEINKEIDKLLSDVKKTLDEANKDVEDAQTLLNEKRADLANAEKELNIKKAELAQAKADLDAAQKELDEVPDGVDTSEEQAKLDEAKAKLDDAAKKVLDAEKNIADYKVQADDAQIKLDNAKDTLDEAEAEFEKAGGTASAKVDEYFEGFTSKIDKAIEKIDELKNESKTFSAATVDEALAQIASTTTGSDLLNKILAKMPSSVDAVVANGTANTYFNNAVNKINEIAADSGYAVAITLADAGEFAEKLDDVVISYESGVATFTATYEDEQFDKLVKEYEDELVITESIMKIEATADIAAMYEGNGNFTLNIVREFKATEKEPETTTTPVVTTTPADTTTTPADTTTTPADTTTTPADTTTTPADTTTTTTTPADTTTTPADTTTTPADTTTTTPADTTTTPADTTTTPGGTTTTPITTTIPLFEFNDCFIYEANGDGIEVTEGYYFSHDTNTFNKGQITKLIATIVSADGREIAGVNLLDTEDMKAKLDGAIIEVNFGDATPNSVFSAENGNKYDVDVYVTGENVTKKLKTYPRVPVTVPVYIGVKGDVNLDNVVKASDASKVLAYYAGISTSTEETDIEMINNNDQYLENLVCFLGDVNEDEYAENNWKKTEAERRNTINASDASYILAYYARISTGSPENSATWDEVLNRTKA